MASSMLISLSRKHSSLLTKPFFCSSISSHFLAKNTQLDSSANFTPASPILETQSLTPSKPTNVCHSFLHSYINYASKNLNLVRSAAGHPRSFPSSTFHGDLKLKETALANTQLKNHKPRYFSSLNSSSSIFHVNLKLKVTTLTDTHLNDPKRRYFSSSSNPKNTQNPRKSSDSDQSSLANEFKEELKKCRKNLSDVAKNAGPAFIVVLAIGSLLSFTIKGTPLEENYKIVSFFQHIWGITQVLGLGEIFAFGSFIHLTKDVDRWSTLEDLDLPDLVRPTRRLNTLTGRILGRGNFVSFGIEAVVKLVWVSCAIALFEYIFGLI